LLSVSGRQAVVVSAATLPTLTLSMVESGWVESGWRRKNTIAQQRPFAVHAV
jgi:hypothetical protein